ncbi:unnamed protein product [Clavelina lepadiformis]|uniref:Uncharacterized protein n=1 Tax=Clavelina lepadiformis TaxID=159417 RepID=A0ABP0FXZ3_CLALP
MTESTNKKSNESRGKSAVVYHQASEDRTDKLLHPLIHTAASNDQLTSKSHHKSKKSTEEVILHDKNSSAYTHQSKSISKLKRKLPRPSTANFDQIFKLNFKMLSNRKSKSKSLAGSRPLVSKSTDVSNEPKLKRPQNVALHRKVASTEITYSRNLATSTSVNRFGFSTSAPNTPLPVQGKKVCPLKKKYNTLPTPKRSLNEKDIASSTIYVCPVYHRNEKWKPQDSKSAFESTSLHLCEQAAHLKTSQESLVSQASNSYKALSGVPLMRSNRAGCNIRSNFERPQKINSPRRSLSRNTSSTNSLVTTPVSSTSSKKLSSSCHRRNAVARPEKTNQSLKFASTVFTKSHLSSKSAAAFPLQRSVRCNSSSLCIEPQRCTSRSDNTIVSGPRTDVQTHKKASSFEVNALRKCVSLEDTNKLDNSGTLQTLRRDNRCRNSRRKLNRAISSQPDVLKSVDLDQDIIKQKTTRTNNISCSYFEAGLVHFQPQLSCSESCLEAEANKKDHLVLGFLAPKKCGVESLHQHCTGMDDNFASLICDKSQDGSNIFEPNEESFSVPSTSNDATKLAVNSGIYENKDTNTLHGLCSSLEDLNSNHTSTCSLASEGFYTGFESNSITDTFRQTIKTRSASSTPKRIPVTPTSCHTWHRNRSFFLRLTESRRKQHKREWEKRKSNMTWERYPFLQKDLAFQDISRELEDATNLIKIQQCQIIALKDEISHTRDGAIEEECSRVEAEIYRARAENECRIFKATIDELREMIKVKDSDELASMLQQFPCRTTVDGDLARQTANNGVHSLVNGLNLNLNGPITASLQVGESCDLGYFSMPLKSDTDAAEGEESSQNTFVRQVEPRLMTCNNGCVTSYSATGANRHEVACQTDDFSLANYNNSDLSNFYKYDTARCLFDAVFPQAMLALTIFNNTNACILDTERLISSHVIPSWKRMFSNVRLLYSSFS